jgi:hypothetical protein
MKSISNAVFRPVDAEPIPSVLLPDHRRNRFEGSPCEFPHELGPQAAAALLGPAWEAGRFQ